MGKHFDKSKAVSITRLSQVGFVLLACAAGAMAFVGLPMATPPTNKDFAVGSDAPIEPPTVARAAPADFAGSAARLVRVANAPKVTPPPDQVDEATPEVAPPEPGLSDIKYLGFANVGALKMALLVVNSKQRFVREGQSVDTERVKLIEHDAVTLSKGESERRIPLQERSAERVTRMQPGPAVNPNAPQQGRITMNPRTRPQEIAGIGGLSKPPEEYAKWPAPYQRRFDRVVNQLLQQGPFPSESDLIEKAKSMIEGDGFRPDDKEGMEKLEEIEKSEAVPDRNDGIPPEKRVPPEKQTPGEQPKEPEGKQVAPGKKG